MTSKKLVGLVWQSDQFDAGRPLPENTQQSKEKDILGVAQFEPAIPANERPQTHALDRAATGIGRECCLGEQMKRHRVTRHKET